MDSSPSPKHVRAYRQDLELEIEWLDEVRQRFSFHLLRCSCPCAACVDELTGKRILNIASVPLTVQPEQLSMTGNYALKIDWNDGHNTGLYTWRHLRSLVPLEAGGE